MVGFISAAPPWAISGLASSLELFDIRLLGDRRERLLEPVLCLGTVHRRVGTLFHSERTWEGDWGAMNKKLAERAATDG